MDMAHPSQGEVSVKRGGKTYTGWYTVDEDVLTVRVPDRAPVTTHLGNFSPAGLAEMLLANMVDAMREEER